MSVFQNTYRKLDRDTSFNKRDPSSYFDCRNFRISSNDPLKSGALSSVNGNLIQGTFASLGYASDSVIGSRKLRDSMILFSTNDDTANPTSSYLRIWKASLGSDSFTMSSIILLYNGLLNCSKQHPIEDIVTFYENENIQKIYWTDYYNNLRYANVATYLTSNGLIKSISNSYIDPDKFNIVQKMDLSVPSFEQMISGIIPVGMVQYAYRLYKLNGSTSNFSPSSQLIPLTTSSMSLQNTTTFKGSDMLDGAGNPLSSGKGVIMKITGIDTDYDRIEVVAIHYSTLNKEPVVYIVDVKPTASTIYFTDEGLYNIGSYTLAEYTLLNNPFKCKTIAAKNNILFAADIEQTEFDFDFDARAYRFMNTGGVYSSKLYEADGGYWSNPNANTDLWYYYNSSGQQVGAPVTMANLPSDIDAINYYNKIIYKSSLPGYIYQKGATIGGEGPNIKYSFEALAGYDTSKRKIDDLGSTVHDTFGGISAVAPYYYSSAESPKTNQILRTFQRDEIYRVGLIGYDDKGRNSPVKWIGDIRTPSNNGDPFCSGTSGNMYSNPIQIKFDIDNLPAEVKYVRIVYVKRTDSDKTILFQGKVGVITASNSEIYVKRPSESTVGTYNVQSAQLPDYINRHIALFSPEISFNKNFNQGSGDYVEVIGTYTGIVENPLASFQSLKCHTLVDNIPRECGVVSARLQPTTITPDEESKSEPFGKLQTYKFYPRMVFYNGSYRRVGNLGTCVLIEMSWAINTSGLNSGSYMLANYRTNRFGVQYGGNTYEDRTRNEYIPAGDIVAVSSGSVMAYATSGDTFINYTDHLTCYYNEFYASGISGISTFGSVEMFPVETSINLAYRLDDCYHRIYKTTPGSYYIREVGNAEFSAFGITYSYGWSDLYLENTVYKRLSDAKKYFPAPIDYNVVFKNDTLVMASEMKEGGETIDPWTQWSTNESINVDKNYGSINKLLAWKNYLLYWQTDAVGVLSVLDRSVISDQEGRSVSIGEGTVLQRYDNIATNIGLNTRFSMADSPNSVYWYDHKRRCMFKFLKGIEDISTIRGVNSYFNSFAENFATYDNTISTALTGKGFFMSYNPIHNEIWFAVKESLSSGVILVYNEVIDSFTNFIDTIGVYFMYFDNKFYSMSGNNLYKEDVGFPGHFYGTYYPSYVTTIVVPMPNMVMTFTNFEISSEVYDSLNAQVHTRTIDYLRVINDFQDTAWTVYNPISSLNSRRLLRTWRIDAGRDQKPDPVTGLANNSRLRDTYAKVELRFVNDINHHSIVLHDLVSLYMIPAETIANKIQQK